MTDNEKDYLLSVLKTFFTEATYDNGPITIYSRAVQRAMSNIEIVLMGRDIDFLMNELDPKARIRYVEPGRTRDGTERWWAGVDLADPGTGLQKTTPGVGDSRFEALLDALNKAMERKQETP